MQSLADITLRPAMPEDSEFVYQTKKIAFRRYVDLAWGWVEADQRAMHERRFAKGEFQIVRCKDLDIGILAFVKRSDRVDVNQLFLLPEYQRKGIGMELMERIMADAKLSSLPVHIQTFKVNLPAQAFAKKLGFQMSGETETHVQWEWKE